MKKFDAVGQAVGYEPFKFEDVNTGMLIVSAGLNVAPKAGKGFYCWGPKNKLTDVSDMHVYASQYIACVSHNKLCKLSCLFLQGKNISQLKKDWVVYHYVGGKKKWSMAKLIESVHSQVKMVFRLGSSFAPVPETETEMLLFLSLSSPRLSRTRRSSTRRRWSSSCTTNRRSGKSTRCSCTVRSVKSSTPSPR